MPFMDDCASPVPDRPVGNTSGRTVHCVKFQKDLPALDTPPWPGDLGQRVFEKRFRAGVEAVGRAAEDDPE